MKTLFALAALAALMNAQPVAKPASETPKVEALANERALTEAEQLKFRATMAEIKNLRDAFKIEDFNKKVQPKADEQLGVIVAACRSVHVPEDKIQPRDGKPSECGFVSGLDDDGNQMKDATGKPIPSRVWWNKPQPQTTAAPTIPQ